MVGCPNAQKNLPVWLPIFSIAFLRSSLQPCVLFLSLGTPVDPLVPDFNSFSNNQFSAFLTNS